MHRIDNVVTSVQWLWIVSVGFFTSTQISYQDDLHKIVITTLSMVVGTVMSFIVKKLLNKFKNK